MILVTMNLCNNLQKDKLYRVQCSAFYPIYSLSYLQRSQFAKDLHDFAMMSICLGFGLFFIFVTEAAGLYCLSCTNSVSPRHCHTVRKCSEGEVCFTESHLSENGIAVFDTGCGSFQACHSNRSTSDSQKRQHGVDPHYQHSRCLECCSSALCNNRGCGQYGYPSARGPVCFDCPQVSDPALCDTIKVCDQNQECYVQQEEEFGDIIYTSSCTSKHACTSTVDIFGKRNAEHCSKCCPSDLCNVNCDAQSSLSTSSSTTVKTTVQTVAPSNPTGSRGTEFLVLFMQNYPSATGLLKTYITTNNTSTLQITSSRNLTHTMKHQIDRNITFTSYTNISFPFDLACHELSAEYKAVIIRTTEQSTVTLFDAYYIGSNDGTLVLPTNKLSTKYLVSTTEGYRLSDDFKSLFAIGVLHNNTQLKIKFNIKNNESIIIRGNKFSSGEVYLQTFGELESLQVSHIRDLTGTYITSNKPVAVFSGNKCQDFLGTGCSHMVSQLPPIDKFDNEYIVPPFFANSDTLIQILSPFHSNVNISTGKNMSILHLNDHGHKNVKITTNEVKLVKSDRPVLVTAYAMGSSSNNPYMTVIPGINQYLDYYKIVVPDQYRDNYLCVIILNGSLSNLHINQMTIGQFNAVYQRLVVLSGKTFSVRIIRIQEGVYTLKTTDQERFGLIVYGHTDNDGYGFAGNFVLP